ncbi:HD domain-containing protein [Mariniflexile fucanivorans]|uniref:HD domain-containing protein n=2 Tax=Mariniflexile fucanivorans TaxID=264023 RepID=A0A4R1RI88_9FLAO|nr:Pycsar system effector family protein [Mariniflexile fucanivorans]TCL65679.1 HD domain-containing protein [Mariniflexile fucanivorans]
MNRVVQNASQYVLEYLNNHLNTSFIYHNYKHTHYVVSKIEELLQSIDLTTEEKEIILLAGWFHDIGYTVNKAKHEDHSMAIAKKYLEEQNYDAAKTAQVLACINATKLGEKPSNLLEEIISDADFAHLADTNYKNISENLRLEFANTDCGMYSNEEWLDENIKVFTNHKYYTKEANLKWSSVKNENLKALHKQLKKQVKKAKSKTNSDNRSERSVDTLFRVTLKNHITLSDIADTKANILLSVNAIIISIALSNLIPKFDNPKNAFLIYPTIIFVVFSVVAIILSVIATRPSITSGKFTKEDVANKKVNLLFFGNFHKMTLPEFEEGITQVMNDKDYLYSSMTKDLYFLGKVLDRKYRILRWTYSIFMIGIIVSVIAFAVSYKYLCVVV